MKVEVFDVLNTFLYDCLSLHSNYQVFSCLIIKVSKLKQVSKLALMADDRTDNIEGLGQHPVRLIDCTINIVL